MQKPRGNEIFVIESFFLFLATSKRLNQRWLKQFLKYKNTDFPGDPVVNILPSNAGAAGVIPAWGAKILGTLQQKNQNIKQEAIL